MRGGSATINLEFLGVPAAWLRSGNSKEALSSMICVQRKARQGKEARQSHFSGKVQGLPLSSAPYTECLCMHAPTHAHTHTHTHTLMPVISLQAESGRISSLS